MNVSNAACSSMIFSGAYNQSAVPRSCEEGSRTPSGLTSGEGSKSDKSVAKVNTTRTVGLAKLCEQKASETSQTFLTSTLGFSEESPLSKSFSQFDSEDILKGSLWVSGR